jgi:hypothetical protein
MVSSSIPLFTLLITPLLQYVLNLSPFILSALMLPHWVIACSLSDCICRFLREFGWKAADGTGPLASC